MQINKQIKNAISSQNYEFILPIPHFERIQTINDGLKYIETLSITNEQKHKLRSRLNGYKYFF